MNNCGSDVHSLVAFRELAKEVVEKCWASAVIPSLAIRFEMN
ncbi:MAG TPA: hypothetical protein VI685_19550 [Candidatus Angelobacter sp.]